VRPRGGPPLIGLVGPIGCGKSTVAALLSERGASVIDADQVTRELMGPHAALTERILDHFGDDLRLPDGSLDRAGLGRLVFSDRELLEDLETIVHPAVRRRIVELIEVACAGTVPFVVLEAIKLVEAGYADACDEVWLVTCDPATQIARLAGRGMSGPDAAQRIAAQAAAMPAWRAAATRIIDTDGSMDRTREAVEAALADLRVRR
jgi:dephospho-CoA kinase